MFISRLTRRARGRYLPWKLWLFGVGAVVTLTGMRFENRWLQYGGFVVLVAAFLLRFLPQGKKEGDG